MNTPYDLSWDVKAMKALRNYYNYFKKNASVAVAERFLEAVSQAVETLLEQPERYPREKLLLHLPQNYRTIPVWDFRIIYEFTGYELMVLFIYHARQDPKKVKKAFEG